MNLIPMLLKCENDLMCGVHTGGEAISTSGSGELWSERLCAAPDVVVLHYMSAVFRHPADPYAIEHIIAVFAEYGVSAHYVINRKGIVFQCVPEDKKAWHAGGSIMPFPDDRTSVNDFSIGIELLATEESGFTEPQYESLELLCCSIEKRWNRVMFYVGHDQIAGERAIALGLRTDRKPDPGPLFDWFRFNRGIARRRGESMSDICQSGCE